MRRTNEVYITIQTTNTPNTNMKEIPTLPQPGTSKESLNGGQADVKDSFRTSLVSRPPELKLSTCSLTNQYERSTAKDMGRIKSSSSRRSNSSLWKACTQPGWRAWLGWGSCTVAGISLGYNCFNINGLLVMDQFKDVDFKYGSAEKAIIVSIFALGVFVGAPWSGSYADKYGRRKAIMSACYVQFFGLVLQIIAGAPIKAKWSIAILCFGRFLSGLSIGITNSAAVTYLTETSPPRLRPSLQGTNQIGLTIGIFLSTCVNYGTRSIKSSAAYRIPVSIQFLWAGMLLLGMVFSPETPRWLMSKDMKDDARASQSQLLGKPLYSSEVNEDILALRNEYAEPDTHTSSSWKDCFRGGGYGSDGRRILNACMIQICQQLTGINFIFYFGTVFFEATAMPVPYIMVIGITAANVLGTGGSFITSAYIGKRILLLAGAVGMALSQFVVAVLNFTDPRKTKYVTYCFMISFCICYATSWSPGAWAVTGDILPRKHRATGIAYATSSNWLANFLITILTPFIVDKQYLGLNGHIFWIWAGLNLFCFAYTWYEVYETKGLSLDEVDQMVRAPNVTPRNSAAWIQRTLATSKVDEEKSIETPSTDISPRNSQSRR
ncbi:hypothetical protein B0O99DRAFT_604448 [Bisporella sp. PMI_857]|nr:hypothetical protein B0O99DRAFT_604448 [Bisporella sp. PMI_857]